LQQTQKVEQKKTFSERVSSFASSVFEAAEAHNDVGDRLADNL